VARRQPPVHGSGAPTANSTESAVSSEEVGVLDLGRPAARPGVVDVAPALEVPAADEPLRCQVLEPASANARTNASQELTRRHSPTSGLAAGSPAGEDGVFVADPEGSSLDPHPLTASTAPVSMADAIARFIVLLRRRIESS